MVEITALEFTSCFYLSSHTPIYQHTKGIHYSAVSYGELQMIWFSIRIITQQFKRVCLTDADAWSYYLNSLISLILTID